MSMDQQDKNDIIYTHCDATLALGPCRRCKIIRGPEVFNLHLSPLAYDRFEDGWLTPLEWAMVATRLTVYDSRLDESRYLAQGFSSRGNEDHDEETLNRLWTPFRTNIQENLHFTCAFLLIWEGVEDLFEQHVMSRRELWHRFDRADILAVIEGFIRTERRMGEVVGQAYRLVKQLGLMPSESWMRRSWDLVDDDGIGGLVDLSLSLWGWRRTEQETARVLLAYPEQHRCHFMYAWSHIVKATPASEHRALVERFISFVPEEHHDRVSKYIF